MARAVQWNENHSRSFSLATSLPLSPLSLFPLSPSFPLPFPLSLPPLPLPLFQVYLRGTSLAFSPVVPFDAPDFPLTSRFLLRCTWHRPDVPRSPSCTGRSSAQPDVLFEVWRLPVAWRSRWHHWHLSSISFSVSSPSASISLSLSPPLSTAASLQLSAFVPVMNSSCCIS